MSNEFYDELSHSSLETTGRRNFYQKFGDESVAVRKNIFHYCSRMIKVIFKWCPICKEEGVWRTIDKCLKNHNPIKCDMQHQGVAYCFLLLVRSYSLWIRWEITVGDEPKRCPAGERRCLATTSDCL